MKRKLFSAILFGAFLIASTSGLTSCKDYDDDISNLQSQIDKLATADQLSAKVSELQAAISAAQSAAEAKAAAAETVAKAAQSAADAAATAASKAQSTADGASQAAKDAAAAAAAAAEVGKAAQAAVDALEAKAATKEELNAAAEAMTAVVNQITADHAADKAAIEASIETAKTDLLAKINANTSAINDLKARLDAVEAKLGLVEGGEAVDLTEISKEIDAIEEALGELVDAYSTMITSINIFKISNGNNTTTGWGGSSATVYSSLVYNPATGNYDWTDYEWPITYYFENGNYQGHNHSVTSDFVQGFDGKLEFYQVKEKGNVFPKNGETDKSLVFEDGYVRTYEDQVLVRVNPVGAVLKKENISLINSQGKELNGLIEVTDVEKYNGLLTGSDYRTRSNEVENGLWVITFKPVDNYNPDDFKAAAISNNSSILYAVSVKNTVNEGTEDESSLNEAVDADRRVISEYGLSLWTNGLGYWDNFQVSDFSENADNKGYKQIYDIHNRYWKCETEGTSTDDIEELEWKNGPDVQITTDNVVDRPVWGDDRQGCGLVIAKVGDQIKIHNDGNIKGFYVTLDYKYARESGKSELNAWNSYSYENVTKISRTGEVIEAGKLQEGPDGYISIKDINDVEGDIIGFRLYAVNLDGTIVNPDGRAFYVGVGTFNNDVELPAQDIAITMDKYLNYFDVKTGRPTGKGISSDYIDVSEAFDVDFDWAGNYSITADRKNYAPVYGTNDDYVVEYWKKNNSGDYVREYDVTSAEYITIKMLNPEAFEDNLDYTLTISLQPNIVGTWYDTRKVSVKFKKTMPDFVPTFSYITEQTKNQIMVPQLADGTKDYTVANDAKYGFKDLNNVYLFDAKSDRFKSDRYFSYDIAYSKYTVVSGVEQVVSKTVTTDYKMTVDGDFVDNDTEHAVNSTYLYQNISKIWDAEHKTYIYGQNNDHSYRVSKATETPLVYMSWAYYNTYRWSKAGENGIPKGDKDNPGKDYAPSVKWLPGGRASLDIDLTKLYVKNSADAATFSKTNLTGYLSDKWLKIKNGSVKTYVGTQVNPYFKPIAWNNSTITLKQVDQNQAAPSAEKHVEKIEFVLIDCFLNEYTVTLDFEVTRD